MSKLKYIVDCADGFVIFPGYIDHDSIGNLLSRRGIDPKGAGFIEIFDGTVTCYGESISLCMKSRGVLDAEPIAKNFDLKF